MSFNLHRAKVAPINEKQHTDSRSTVTIDYVDARAGAGKTYGAASVIREMIANDQKVLLVQPTTRLVAETIKITFPAMSVPTDAVTEITLNTTQSGVIAGIIDHMNHAPDGLGEVVVITHAAFVLLSGMYAHGRSRWTVIVDEVPDVQGSFCFNLPNTHELVTSHLQVEDQSDPSYWPLEKKPGSTTLDVISRNPMKDDIYSSIQGFASCVLAEDWDVLVKADSYTTLTEALDVRGVSRQLNAFAVLKPTIFDGYRRVVVMAACFTETMFYLVWSRLKVNPVNFRDVTSTFSLRYAVHPNGDTINFYYATDRHFSKRFRNRRITDAEGEETTVFEALRNAASEIVGSHQVAVLVNNDIKNAESLFENGVKLPAYSHGLNTYQHLDNAVLMLAANPTGAHFDFLRRYTDLSEDEIKTAMHRQVIYQAVARISVRDVSNLNPKTVFLPDGDTASWLSGLFPGSRVTKIDDVFSGAETEIAGKIGRPKVYENAAEKQRAYRERKDHEQAVKLERELRLRLINGDGIADRFHQQAAELGAAMTELANARVSKINRAKFQGTFFGSRFETEGHSHQDDWRGLVIAFRDASAQPLASKHDGLMWSPAHYIANSPNVKASDEYAPRAGYINIACTRHIMLDNDGGDLTHDQFAAMFPNLEMVVYSTWSSSQSQPKWRALIPTEFVMDIESYRCVTSALTAHLNDRGFYGDDDFKRDPKLASRRGVKNHGFDASKLKATDRFFLPCVGKHPEAALFVEYRGAMRGMLDVYAWADRCPVAAPEKPVEALEPIVPPKVNPNAAPVLQRLQAALIAQRSQASSSRRALKLEQAIARWNAEGDRTGYRDRGWWELGVALKNAGCDAAAFKAQMRSASSKAELRGKINRIWRRLDAA